MNFLFAFFVGLMGLLFFLPPFGFLLYKLSFRLRSRKAEAKVLRIERNRDPDTGSTMIQPVFEFWTRDGERMEVRTGVRYGLRYMPVVGSTVKLYYRPGTEPLKFDVASRGLWHVSAALMLTGLVLMAPAILYFLILS
ncbi:MAG TPA: DUF3592 domain-containing protein [bacterium]|nr:DUF3592 domain-containing protein [bacterium]